MAFANCQTETKNLELTKGLVINSSITFDSTKIGGTVLLTSKDNYEKMITIEGENLTIDFGGITLLGTDYLTRPNEFGGVAIHIKKSKNVTVKNLNVSGFRIALQADSVEYLTIDSCNFSYNYRADSSANFDINKVEIGALMLNNCTNNIKVINSTISNNESGIVLNNSNVYQIMHNHLQFNKIGLYYNNSTTYEMYFNCIDWNIIAGNWFKGKGPKAMDMTNSITHNGHYSVDKIYQYSNDFSFTNIELDKTVRRRASLISPNIPKLDPKYPKGEAYKLRTKYGVYNFEYPAIFLRTVHENEYVFAMFGPQIGNWKFVNAENVRSTNLKTGAFPATFRIQKEDVTKPFSIEFEFIGTGFYDEFGVWNKKGKVYKFGAKI